MSGKTVLAYSNVNDCRRYRLDRSQFTPWNWASNWVLEQAKLTRSDDVLDLGCTNNPYVLAAAKNCHSLILCDLAPPSEVPELPPNATYYRTDLCMPLPFGDASFDVVLSESTLEHLPVAARLACFREAMRVLRPGGRLCVSVGLPLRLDGDAETERLMRELPFFADRRCSIFAPVSIRDILNDGLSVTIAPDNIECLNDRLLEDPALIRQDYAEIREIPDLAGLKRVSLVEIGISHVKEAAC